MKPTVIYSYKSHVNYFILERVKNNFLHFSFPLQRKTLYNENNAVGFFPMFLGTIHTVPFVGSLNI